MAATLSAGIDSLVLKLTTPVEADGVTPRDDLISVKVWYSTTNNFVPPAQGTLAYDGTGLDISITGLTSGTTYYVRYAFISEIQPEYYILSAPLVGTPVYETQTVDYTPPPTPTGVEVTAGVNTIFIKHDVPVYTQGRGHQKTHVFGLKSSPAQALLGYTFANAAAQGSIGQFTGNLFSFSSDPATEWHIWLKWESNNGVLSTVASGGTTGNTATTSVDVSLLLEALTGEISTSELTSALSSSVGTIPNLNNQYTIKVNNSGQVAGFGLASTTTSSGNIISDFAVQADKFWIAPPAFSSNTAPTLNLYRGFVWRDTGVTPAVIKYWSGTEWSLVPQTLVPFTVVTTPQTINGVSVPVGVYMDAAFIKDGTITTAKIGTATITSAKIASVDATTITVGQLTANQINSNGLSIRDTSGNLLLDASNSQLGVSLYVGSGANQRLLSTIGAFASVPNTAYIGEFASAPAFSAARTISSWSRTSGITTVTTTAVHGFVIGSKVTITLSDATLNGTHEIIDVVSNTVFKILNTGTNATGSTGTATGFLYAANSVYKNTTDDNSYILTGTTLAWSLFLEKGYTPVLGVDYYQPASFDITTSGAAFTKNAAGTILPASLSLATVVANVTSPTYQWQKNNVNISGATSSTYTVPVADYSAAVTNTYKCIVTGTIAGVASSTIQDSITIPLLQDGSSAVQVTNSNENITFTADTTGFAGISFTNGSSVIKAYIGTTALTYAASGANTFSATQAATGANVGAGTGTGTTYTVPAPTAMSAETASTVVTVTIRDAASAVTNITTTISYSLSRKGVVGDPGAPGTNGTNGTNGARGSAWAYLSPYTIWNATTETAVNTYFTNTYGTKVLNDTVTVYGTNFSQTRTWNGTSWIQVTVAIDGNLLVTGTVSGAAIVANSITAGKIDSRELTIKDAAGNIVLSSGNAVTIDRITNPDNLIPDDGFYSPSFWLNNDALTAFPTGWTANSGTNPTQPVSRFIQITNAAGTFDYSSKQWSIAPGKPYRVRLWMFMSTNFAGFISPAIHFPNSAWAVPGNTVGDPLAVFQAGHTLASWGGTGWRSAEAVYTANASYSYLNTRIAGRITAGSCQIYMEVLPVAESFINQGAFSTLSKITTGNISTYIDSVAIGSAYIADGAITNAKIGTAAITNAKIGSAEVGTLTIAGNAVTTMGGISGSTGQTFYLNASVGGILSINIFAAAFGDDSTPVSVYVDGVLRANVVGQSYVSGVVSAGESGTDTITYSRTSETQLLLLAVGAGNHSIQVTTPGRTYACVGFLTLR